MKDYLIWLLTEHKTGRIKSLLFLIGIAHCIAFTDDLVDEFIIGDMPLLVLVIGLIAMYGFTIGIAYQPYTIYKRLKRLNK